jgi:hypothetical protein
MGQLQHISKNYFRVKHYLGSVDGKLKFEYHKQSFEYIQRILNETNQRKKLTQMTQKALTKILIVWA